MKLGLLFHKSGDLRKVWQFVEKYKAGLYRGHVLG